MTWVKYSVETKFGDSLPENSKLAKDSLVGLVVNRICWNPDDRTQLL